MLNSDSYFYIAKDQESIKAVTGNTYELIGIDGNEWGEVRSVKNCDYQI